MKPSKAKYVVDKLFDVKNDEDFSRYLAMKFENNKKIYKYCPIDWSKEFEKNYSIINLINSNIYISIPSEFNDPFDASMGLSEEVIYDQLMLGMLNEQYLDNSSVDNIRITKKDLSTYANFTTTVDLMECSLIKDIFSYYAVSEQRYNDLVRMRSNEKGKDIMLKVLSDKEFSKRLFSHLINPDLYSETNIDKLVVLLNEDNIKKLSDPSVKIPLISANQKENLFNKDILYSQVERFGMDKSIVDGVIDKMQQTLADLSMKMSEYIDLNIGISCFSETHDHELMWSHYANKHKGFCIEYDMDLLTKNNPKFAGQLIPVIYTDTRPIIDKNIISSFSIKDKKVEAAIDANKYFTKALVTKAKIWRYEKEWRVISKATDGREISFDCITGIYLGAKASSELIEFMKELCFKEKINLYQYSIDIKTYKLNLATIYTNEVRLEE